MSSHPPSASMTITLSTAEDSYPPYMVEEDTEKARAESVTPGLDKHSKRRQPRVLTFYRSMSWMLGFRDKYSLFNCFVWGGALFGFCLARAMAMNPGRTPHLLVPGEWFWLSQSIYKPNLFIHIYLATFGGIGALFQFLPVIRRRKVILHRINGYAVLFCLIVAVACGSVIARRSFGGEANSQSSYYVQAIMIIYAALMGIYNVKKDTRRHRKWMLRMVTYFASVLTARLIALPARAIMTVIGTYYTVWRCDEVINLLRAPETIQGSFPQCTSGINPADVYVAVHASTRDLPLHVASAARAAQGMALWIAIVIHIIGVEFYIFQTDAANQVRLNFALEPRDFTQN
ncbi:hypothetical protein DFH08DRAFT_868325 [Mycena albidolilacea]|uniref:DUF2306 domain-containing protein n=1 Tax=Mycena albidolilacea TaxID=1033008 RepID=A0AAD7A1H2_9AGAR|nr:hypothetical protein DFH08DRAFT_868325 [Mycena albidolilacea]